MKSVPDRPLRVLQVVQRFYPELGGLETHVAEVTSRLAGQADLDITIAATDRSGKLPREDRINGVRVLRRRSWPRESDIYLAPGLFGVIRRGRFDVVHVQGSQTMVPTVAMLAARLARIPYVVTFHSGGHSSDNHAFISRIQHRINRPLFAHASKLIAVSRFERRRFQELTGLPAERFTVINNGGALPPVPTGTAPEPGTIVTSGRLERYKGHHRVIQALPLIRRSVPGARLTVLGSGPYEVELRRLAQERDVEDAVTFRHLLPTERSEMAGILSRSSVMAALSTYEAHPVAVMEAVAIGLPVVGFDVAGIADLVEDGLVHGLDVAADDTAVAGALVDRLRATTAAPHRAPEIVLPTWESCAEQVGDVYRAVDAADRPAADRPTRPLRVVQVIATLTSGGAERQLQSIVANSRNRHHTISLYADGPVGDALRAAGEQVEVLHATGPGKLLAVPRLVLRLRRLRPDVVHVHLLSGQLWGLPAARLAGVRAVVSTEHSLMDDSIENRPLTPTLRRLYLGLNRLAAVTVAVSAETRRRLTRWGVPVGRIREIPNGIDFDAVAFDPAARAAIRAELGAPETTQLVGAVGRLESVKRFPQLLAALAPTLQRGRRELVIAGGGPLRDQLLSAAAALGVADAVHVLGPRSDVPRLLSAFDVLVSPSRDETFGMAVLEALGAGLPVVTAQCPALDELSEPAGLAIRLPAATFGDAAEASAIRDGVDQALAAAPHSRVPAPALERAFGIRSTTTRLDTLYADVVGAVGKRWAS